MRLPSIWFVPLTLALVFADVGESNAEPTKKKIGLIAFDGVLTSEIAGPAEVLGLATKKPQFSDYEVVVIAAGESRELTTSGGMRIMADLTIHDPVDLEVLLVPSAYDILAVLANEPLVHYISRHGAEVEWLGSNCAGAFILAHAGLLDGVKATTFSGGEPELEKHYPAVDVQHDQNVVIDGRVITSNGGLVSYQAAFALLEQLGSPELVEEVAAELQWARLQTAFGADGTGD